MRMRPGDGSGLRGPLGSSSTAVLVAAAFALPLATLLAHTSFRGKRVVLLLLRAGMGAPTVFIGLVMFGLLSRQGPLGDQGLLYTPAAIVAGELLLAFPILAVLSHGALTSLDPRIGETARSLGASRWRQALTELSEARIGVVLALLTAMARCLTELGIAVMVGGNIKGRTRTLSTAIALETGKGEFARGLAMGLVLIVLAFAIALISARLAEREKSGDPLS